MLLNSSINEVAVSTVKAENVFSLKVCTVSDLVPESYSVVSGLSEFVIRHLLLYDVLELIDASYSVHVMAFIGSKYLYAAVCLYVLFFTEFDLTDVVLYFPVLISVMSFEIMQLVTVLYCCKSACLQVGII